MWRHRPQFQNVQKNQRSKPELERRPPAHMPRPDFTSGDFNSPYGPDGPRIPSPDRPRIPGPQPQYAQSVPFHGHLQQTHSSNQFAHGDPKGFDMNQPHPPMQQSRFRVSDQRPSSDMLRPPFGVPPPAPNQSHHIHVEHPPFGMPPPFPNQQMPMQPPKSGMLHGHAHSPVPPSMYERSTTQPPAGRMPGPSGTHGLNPVLQSSRSNIAESPPIPDSSHFTHPAHPIPVPAPNIQQHPSPLLYTQPPPTLPNTAPSPSPALDPFMEGRMNLQHNILENASISNESEFVQTVSDSYRGLSGANQGKACLQEQDQSWLNEWLQQKQLWHKPKPERGTKSTLTIPQARRMIRETLKLIEDLKTLRAQLEEQIESNSEAWEPLCHQAYQKKVQLENIQSKLNDEFLQELSFKIKKTKKKRLRLKHKRMDNYEEKEEAMKWREGLHATIDRWREGILRKDADAKREKEIKAAADETMSEVRRKIADIRKMQQLFQALHKLRQLRKESAEKQGRFTPREADRVFKERMDKLQASVNNRNEIYEAEQKTLQVMLEMEQKETHVRDKEAERLKWAAKTKRKERQLREYLFGKDVVIQPTDPLFPSQQYYNQASQNLAAFLQIRREWDMYLVPEGTPGGSRIPPGWVAPVAPSNDNWASVLKDQQGLSS